MAFNTAIGSGSSDNRPKLCALLHYLFNFANGGQLTAFYFDRLPRLWNLGQFNKFAHDHGFFVPFGIFQAQRYNLFCLGDGVLQAFCVYLGSNYAKQ